MTRRVNQRLICHILTEKTYQGKPKWILVFYYKIGASAEQVQLNRLLAVKNNKKRRFGQIYHVYIDVIGKF